MIASQSNDPYQRARLDYLVAIGVPQIPQEVVSVLETREHLTAEEEAAADRQIAAAKAALREDRMEGMLHLFNRSEEHAKKRARNMHLASLAKQRQAAVEKALRKSKLKVKGEKSAW